MGDSHGVPPLVYAAKRKNKSACQILLEAGADVNATEENSPHRTGLHYAIYGEQLDIFQLFLQ